MAALPKAADSVDLASLEANLGLRGTGQETRFGTVRSWWRSGRERDGLSGPARDATYADPSPAGCGRAYVVFGSSASLDAEDISEIGTAAASRNRAP